MHDPDPAHQKWQVVQSIDQANDFIERASHPVVALICSLVTNFHAGPLHVQHRPVYWCWLTRIDKVEASLGQHTVTIDADRTITQSGGGLAEIAAFIAARLAILPESPDTQPPRPDEQEEAQVEDEAVAGMQE